MRGDAERETALTLIRKGEEGWTGVRLRPYFGRCDYEHISKWIKDERTHRLWCGDLLPYPVSQESMEGLLERDAREWDGHGFIATEDDGTPIGFFCYSVNAADNSGFLKFVVLDPDLRGKGNGTRMIGLALKYAFAVTGVDSVGINVFDVNQGARRCYEKAGFVLRGVTEAAYRYGDEEWGRCHMAVQKAQAADLNGRPEYLYHGSQYRFDVVVPHAASGECERESQRAIYAAETLEEVIPFALPIRWYPDSPEGRREFTCSDGVTQLQYGSLDPDGVGYVYKLRSDGFEKIDGWQWISRQETVPEEVIEIRVRDYLDRVTFSEEARKISELLYGDGKGRSDVLER